MATQIVTVAKIAGESSKLVIRAFERWGEVRVPSPREPTLGEPGQWPTESRAEMAEIAAQIHGNAANRPIVFYNQHIDLWSMGDVFRQPFPKNGNTLQDAMFDDTDLLCYPLPDGNALHNHLNRELRRTGSVEETLWYLRVLQQAVSAWSQVVEEAAIVVLRRAVGAFVTDEQIVEGNNLIPSWLRGYNTA
jgi:hypothetical protein